jgi:hypothetical protein
LGTSLWAVRKFDVNAYHHYKLKLFLVEQFEFLVSKITFKIPSVMACARGPPMVVLSDILLK